MKNVLALAAALALLGLAIAAQADVLNMGTGFTSLETVRVGDPGNVADTRIMGYDGTTGYGSVGYSYSIGKYEVTTKQYCEFLNKVAKDDTYGVYTTTMCVTDPNGACGCGIERSGSPRNWVYTVADDWANRPVNYVSFLDACRFANWLHNGQPSGPQDSSTTERGAYILDGYRGTDGRTIHREAGCKWAVTSEDEWYKAAYYKGGGTNAGYWNYPTNGNQPPINVGSDNYIDPGNHANYGNGSYTLEGVPYYRSIVGEFEHSASAYGTFDQGGNVWEWNETVIRTEEGFHYSYAERGLRGGSYDYWDTVGALASSCRMFERSSDETMLTGFRVVYLPEPSPIIGLIGGFIGFLGVARRRP